MFIGSSKIVAASLIAAVAVAATAASTMHSEAAAMVGRTSTVEIPKPTEKSVDKLRADYRRPQFIPFPKDDPYTAEKAVLGKKLYFDTRLSEAHLLSCASCHNPAYAWGDGQPKGVGHLMKELGRRSPSIINAAYGQIFMWDGRMGSLE